MAMDIQVTDQALVAAGFKMHPTNAPGTSIFAPSFTGPSFGDWQVSAHPAKDFHDRSVYSHVTINIHPTQDTAKGTQHRVFSVAGLSNLPSIIGQLQAMVADPEKLKCPKCKTRFVHMKEDPGSGSRYAPFLSCDGMMMPEKKDPKTGRKEPFCKGTSIAFPALINYP
jgi:hypothetical protein